MLHPPFQFRVPHPAYDGIHLTGFNMYVQAHFAEQETATLHDLITKNPLSTWVMHDLDDLLINHLPFLLDASQGRYGTLLGHVPRANPVWKSCSSSRPSAVVFHGHQGYISPSWYPSKQEHHRVVPTWNYAVVHAHGIAEVIEDRDWLLAHVTQLSQLHEATQAMPWKVSDAPSEFIKEKLGAIVGIKITIDKLIGKFKLNQNRSEADQQGVIARLGAATDPQSAMLAAFMTEQCQNKA